MRPVETISIAGPDGGRERLALRLERPAGPARPVAILYLHGFGSSQSGEKAGYFRSRAVAAGWPFCSFDARGHGASEGSLERLTLTRNLADLAAVRAWLSGRGLPRVALFGSSMGAATALWHAALEPEGIAGAMHVAPALGMLGSLERRAGADGLARWEREGWLDYRSELVESRLSWALVEDLRAHPTRELARRTRTPTLLFQGQADATVDWRETARFAADAGPAVELRLFPAGDHRLLEHLETIWSEGEAFLLRRSG
jgi:pimeloyl-ACP methyl ester carboxylesterase